MMKPYIKASYHWLTWDKSTGGLVNNLRSKLSPCGVTYWTDGLIIDCCFFWALKYLHESLLCTILYCKWLSLVPILLEGLRNRYLLWGSQTWTIFQDLNSCSLRSTLPIHLSTKQNLVFANSHSNIWVVCSITRFNGQLLELSASLFELQQASYNIAPQALGWFIALGCFAPSGDKSASALVAML